MTAIFKRLVIGLVLALTAILAWNYISVWRPTSKALEDGPRNQFTQVAVYHQYLVNPSILIFDLRSISDRASQSDVMRALLQSANALKAKSFDTVILAYKGNPKFLLKGDYFKKIGNEYEWQNPLHTIQNLPKNTFNLDQSPAFGSWTGGWLGVMNAQLKDLNTLHQKWYLNDWAAE